MKQYNEEVRKRLAAYHNTRHKRIGLWVDKSYYESVVEPVLALSKLTISGFMKRAIQEKIARDYEWTSAPSRVLYVRSQNTDMLVTYDGYTVRWKVLDSPADPNSLDVDDSGWNAEHTDNLERFLNLDGKDGKPSEILNEIIRPGKPRFRDSLLSPSSRVFKKPV